MMADKKSTAAEWTANQRSPEPIRVTTVQTADELAALVLNVDINPAKIVFPTDVWGFTSPLRKAALLAASGVKGQQDKHDLLIATIDVLRNHIVKRKAVDATDKAARQVWRQTQEDELLVRTRQHGLPPEEAVPVISKD
jgi:hypothetical protein